MKMQKTIKITGNWSQLKTKLKQKYPNLSDSDLVYSEGKEDELLTNISKRTGKTQDEISRVIEELQSKSTEKTTSVTESTKKETKEPSTEKATSKNY